MADSIHWGSFSSVSLQEEPYYLGFCIRVPDFWRFIPSFPTNHQLGIALGILLLGTLGVLGSASLASHSATGFTSPGRVSWAGQFYDSVLKEMWGSC